MANLKSVVKRLFGGLVSKLEFEHDKRNIMRLGKLLGPDEESVEDYNHRGIEFNIQRAYNDKLKSVRWTVGFQGIPIPKYDNTADWQHNGLVTDIFKHLLLYSIHGRYEDGILPGDTNGQYGRDEKNMHSFLQYTVHNAAQGHEIAHRFIDNYLIFKDRINQAIADIEEIVYRIDKRTHKSAAFREMEKMEEIGLSDQRPGKYKEYREKSYRIYAYERVIL